MKTGDCYLLHYSDDADQIITASKIAGELSNPLGLLLMLHRDELFREQGDSVSWSTFIEYTCGIDTATGKAGSARGLRHWQEAVRLAESALCERISPETIVRQGSGPRQVDVGVKGRIEHTPENSQIIGPSKHVAMGSNPPSTIAVNTVEEDDDHELLVLEDVAQSLTERLHLAGLDGVAQMVWSAAARLLAARQLMQTPGSSSLSAIEVAPLASRTRHELLGIAARLSQEGEYDTEAAEVEAFIERYDVGTATSSLMASPDLPDGFGTARRRSPRRGGHGDDAESETSI